MSNSYKIRIFKLIRRFTYLKCNNFISKINTEFRDKITNKKENLYGYKED